MSKVTGVMQIAPQDVRDTAGALGRLSGEADEARRQLSHSWNRLDGGWEWYAAEDINGHYGRAMDTLDRMVGVLREMDEALVKTADLIEQADLAAAAFFELGADGAGPGVGVPPLEIGLPGGTAPWPGIGYTYPLPGSTTVPYNGLPLPIDSGGWPEPSTGWGYDLSLSTTQFHDNLDAIGNLMGWPDLGGQASQFLSWAALGLDATAEGLDLCTSGIVTLGIFLGATGGVVVGAPGGGTTVLTGGAGAMAGWGLTELAVRPLLLGGNALASVATLATIGSDFLSGANRIDIDAHVGQDGFRFDRSTTIAPGTQISAAATAYGWLAPISYLSLAGQTVAVGADIVGLAGTLPLPPLTETISVSGSSTGFEFGYDLGYGSLQIIQFNAGNDPVHQP